MHTLKQLIKGALIDKDELLRLITKTDMVYIGQTFGLATIFEWVC